MKKILLPIDSPGMAHNVVQEAAFVARTFAAELTLLHVFTPLSYPAGLLEAGHEMNARDLHVELIRRLQKELDQCLQPELEGIAVRRLLVRGEPAREIIATARTEQPDLIMMATQGLSAVYRLLLGSVTAKVLHDVTCPVWVSPLDEDSHGREFRVKQILCALNLNAHSRRTLSKAVKLAADLDARVSLVHVTAGAEMFGPGGLHEDSEWKSQLADFAAKEIAALQKEVGTQFDVIIESGNAPHVLKRVAHETKADLLVLGHMPRGGHLGANGNGYSIIRESPVPVLSL